MQAEAEQGIARFDGYQALQRACTMAKKDKKKSVIKILKESKSARKLGKTLTLLQLHDQYVGPELRTHNRKYSTTTSVERHVKRFDTWWSTVSKKPLPLADITIKHLELFREWLNENNHSVSLQNSAVAAVTQCLNVAVARQFIHQAPKLKALPYTSRTIKIYPNDEAICKIWDACDCATWPKKTFDKKPLPYSPAMG